MKAITPRPSRNDPAIRTAAIKSLAADCAKWDGGDPDPVYWERAFERISLSNNGYEIARDLDSYAGVQPDAELVEILDSASSYLWREHDRLVEAWVAETQPAPQFAIGDYINCRRGVGRISGIEHRSARYMFVPDGEEERFKTGGGVLIEFEAAETAPESAPA